jgi:hypothetical protein
MAEDLTGDERVKRQVASVAGAVTTADEEIDNPALRENQSPRPRRLLAVLIGPGRCAQFDLERLVVGLVDEV